MSAGEDRIQHFSRVSIIFTKPFTLSSIIIYVKMQAIHAGNSSTSKHFEWLSAEQQIFISNDVVWKFKWHILTWNEQNLNITLGRWISTLCLISVWA